MKTCFALFLTLVFIAPFVHPQAVAQSQTANSNTASAASIIPRYVRFSGLAPQTSLQNGNNTVGVTFALYADQTGGAPLWLETQNVTMDASGHYSVLLGSASKDGLPADLFASGEARWLGIKIGDNPEQARVLLVSVPYALKAGDAETLGGKPLSAFVLAPSQTATGNTSAAQTTIEALTTATTRSITPRTQTLGTITANFLPLFTDASGTLGNSNVFQSASGNLGVGTTNPGALLNVGALNNSTQLYGSSPGLFVSTPTAHAVPTAEIKFSPANPNCGGCANIAEKVTVSDGTGSGKTNYGLWIDSNSAANNYAIYANSGLNHFGDAVDIGNVGGSTQAYGFSPGLFVSTPTPHTVPTAEVKFSPANPNCGGCTNIAEKVTVSDGSGSGKTNYGLWIDSNSAARNFAIYANSGMTYLAGNVGIGTANPSNPLTVAGTIQSLTGGFMFPDGSVLTSATTPTVTGSTTYNGTTTNQILYAVQNQVGNTSGGFSASGVPSGVRGDSTTTTGYAAGVFGSAASPLAPGVAGVNVSTCPASGTCNGYGLFGWSVQASNGVGVWGQADATTAATNVGVYGQSKGDDGTGVFGYASSTNSNTSYFPTGVYGRTDNPNGNGVWGFANSSSGNTVGVYGQVASISGVAGLFDAPTSGTILEGRVGSPGSTPTKVFHVDAGGNFFGKSFTINSADFAEAVDAVGTKAAYEPGDVMMIDESGTRRIALANEPYSTKVAGVFSTQPAVLGTEHPMDDPRISKEVPLAIVGIVPCKVSAENGAIHAGDLLVTASIPGYAMKGTDRSKMLGAIVGKALGSLDKGTGTIEVLVSLH